MLLPSPRSFLLLRHATSDFPGAAKCPSLSLATTNLSYLGRDQFLREILSREREKDEEGSVKRRRRLILFMLLLPLASQSRPPPNQKDTQKSFGPNLSSLPLCGGGGGTPGRKTTPFRPADCQLPFRLPPRRRIIKVFLREKRNRNVRGGQKLSTFFPASFSFCPFFTLAHEINLLLIWGGMGFWLMGGGGGKRGRGWELVRTQKYFPSSSSFFVDP